MPANLNQPESSSSRIPWLLLSRLSIFVLLLIIVVLFLHVPNFLLFPFVVFSCAILTLLLLIAFGLNRSHGLLFGTVVAVQFAFEIGIETGIIHYTGGIDSPYVLLFILTILSASLVYRLAGSTIVAGLSSTAYILLLWTKEGMDFSIGNLQALNDASFYKAFLYICTFFLTALISGYLAQKLKVKGEELWSASMELKKLKTDTGEILRHLRSGIITIDAWGKIVYFNRAAEEILDYSEAQVKGKDCREAFNDRMPHLAEKILEVIKFNQEDSRGLLYVEGKNNRRVPIGISTSIMGNKEKGIRGVIAIFQDITEVIKLEERIRVADRLAAVGELSAGIAHEIRNPLASISGSVEVLKDELSLTEENQKLLELIVKETGRLNKILTDFLEYARIGPSMLGKVELVRLLAEVIQIAQKHPSSEPGMSVRKSLSSDPLYVLGEENQIKQVFLNLLVNAMESMQGKEGEILITDQSLSEMDRFYFQEEEPEDSEWVPIAIADQGNGINEEQKEKIFSPFYSTKKSGTGLGLAIVQRLVNNLGGKIEFRSETDRGSVFVVFLQKYEKGKAKLVPPVDRDVDLAHLIQPVDQPEYPVRSRGD
ncbi:MAG: ATP-binding protein [Candidatus Zixiibacteriota bacterium]